MRRSRGYTLTEVMIALGLSGLVMAGAFGIMASQRGTYQEQNALARRQQELWVALEFVQRDVRKAGMGFGMCQHTVGTTVYHASVDCYPASAGSVQELRPIDFADGGTSASDTLTITYAQPLGDGVPDGKLTAVATAWTSTTLDVDDAVPFMTPLGCSCAGSPACTAPTSSYALLYYPTDANRACSLVEITGANCSTKKLTIQPRPDITGCLQPAYTPNTSTTYTSGAGNGAVLNLGTLQRVTYAIGTTTTACSGNPPCLTRAINGGAGQIIAYGIEDLQIVPACDANGSGLIDPEGTGGLNADEWFNNIASDTVPATCTNYPMVRVSMIARLPASAPGLAGAGRPALENRAAGAADSVRRRKMSVIASAPNLAI